jgi:hypothetical protein
MDRLVVSLMMFIKGPRPPYQDFVMGLFREFAEYYYLEIEHPKKSYDIREYFLRGPGTDNFCSWMRERYGLQVRPFLFETYRREDESPTIFGYGFEFDKDENLTACLLKMGFDAA